MRSEDEKTKTFNFYYDIKNNDKVSKGITITHITEATSKLERVQGLLDNISRNIYLKNDIDKELTQSNTITFSYLCI